LLKSILLLPLLAAVVRAAALPGWWLPELALLVVPLRILYWERGGGRLGDYLGGVLHVLLYFSFLVHVHPLAPYPVAIILGAWWLGERWIYHGLRRHLPAGISAALAIVAVEYFRFHWPMGGVPWGSLALGLAERPVSLNWSSVLGESGLIVLVAFWGAFCWALFKRQSPWELLPAPLLTLLAMIFVAPLAPTESSVRCLAIQGNLTIDEKHGGTSAGGKTWTARDVFLRQALLTVDALAQAPDAELVLWSETMYPYPLVPEIGEPYSEGFMRRPWSAERIDMVPLPFLRDFSRRRVADLIGPVDSGRFFVAGAHYYFGVPENSEVRSPRSSEFLAMDASGRVVDHFSKSRLVPFGENLPFRGHFPGAKALAMKMFEFMRLYPIFAHTGRVGPLHFNQMNLGGAVCWENVYEQPFRSQADAGAEAFLILSNENWYGLSAEMDQMVAATKLRSRETGRPVLRVANTGITMLTDAGGHLLGSLPRGEKGYLVVDLERISGAWRTPYMVWGWPLQPLLAWLTLAVAVVLRSRARSASKNSQPDAA
jgi:apolipoprotein N-acyltransferase